jgi:hypothetical protein
VYFIIPGRCFFTPFTVMSPARSNHMEMSLRYLCHYKRERKPLRDTVAEMERGSCCEESVLSSKRASILASCVSLML